MNQQPPRHQPAPSADAARWQITAKLQRAAKLWAIGAVPGIGLTAAGIQLLVTHGAKGLPFLLAGLVFDAIGVASQVRITALRRELRRYDSDLWKSRVAHLPQVRRAAALGAWIMGFTVLISLAIVIGGAVMMAQSGSFDQPLGAALCAVVLSIPLMFGLAAATAIPHIVRCAPAGARLGLGLLLLVTAGASLSWPGRSRASTTWPPPDSAPLRW